MSAVTDAYKKLFNQEPAELAEWQVAERVMDNFNVPLISEELAREVILEVINHIQFPNDEITKEVVGKAERLSTELFDELNKPNKEPHMAEIEYLEFKKGKR